MGCEMMTAAELNERNRVFWEEQRRLLDQRLSDITIAKVAHQRIQREMTSLPLALQVSFEGALADAEAAAEIIRADYARDIASAARPDPLQEFIVAALKENPGLTVQDLHAKLRAAANTGAFGNVTDGVIEFHNRRGRLKQATVSGLKDRLSRARQKLHSR